MLTWKEGGFESWHARTFLKDTRVGFEMKESEALVGTVATMTSRGFKGRDNAGREKENENREIAA